MKRKSIAFYALGNFLVVGALFGVIELTTRTWSWMTGEGWMLALHELDGHSAAVENVYRWHPFTGLTFKPVNELEGGHPNQASRSRVAVDQFGFLAPQQQVDYTPHPDTIRIATIGASTTANLNLNYADNWPGHLGGLLQDALPNTRIQIINAGVPGFDTAQSVTNLALRVMPLKPDVVIIYHAYNDLKAVRPHREFQPDYAHIHPKPFGYLDKPPILLRFLDHSMFYVRLRNKLRESQEISELETLSLADGDTLRLSQVPDVARQVFEQHMRIMIATARAEQARVVLSSFATLHDPTLDYRSPEVVRNLSERQLTELYLIMNFIPGLTVSGVFDGIQKYNDSLRQIAEAENTAWIDNAALVPHEDTYFVDRVHFSREGARQVAVNMLPVVLEEIRKRQGTARAIKAQH